MCNLDHGDSRWSGGQSAPSASMFQYSESDALPLAVTCGADSQVGSRRSRSMTLSPLPEMHVDVEQTTPISISRSIVYGMFRAISVLTSAFT